MGTDFGWALGQLWDGAKVQRAGWNGKGMWIALKPPNPDSDMTRTYIYMRPADGGWVPWVASQTDLLASDWRVFGEES